MLLIWDIIFVYVKSIGILTLNTLFFIKISIYYIARTKNSKYSILTTDLNFNKNEVMLNCFISVCVFFPFFKKLIKNFNGKNIVKLLPIEISEIFFGIFKLKLLLKNLYKAIKDYIIILYYCDKLFSNSQVIYYMLFSFFKIYYDIFMVRGSGFGVQGSGFMV